jgi:hypothetical protein
VRLGGTMSQGFDKSIATPLQPHVPAPLGYAAAIIQYSYYLIGALVLGMIGLAFLSVYSGRAKKVDERPSFRLHVEHLARLPLRSQVVAGTRLGRIETYEYGAIHHRDVNLALAVGFPPKDAIVMRDSMPRLSDIKLLGNARVVYSSTHYDLDTRFGAVRATDIRVDSDGQWKQCLAFVSRFDTTSVYLMGWYCDPSGAKPSAGKLACTLDRLEVDSPLASREADAYLRERVARPATCSAWPVTQTIDTTSRRPSPPSRWSTPSAQQRR